MRGSREFRRSHSGDSGSGTRFSESIPEQGGGTKSLVRFGAGSFYLTTARIVFVCHSQPNRRDFKSFGPRCMSNFRPTRCGLEAESGMVKGFQFVFLVTLSGFVTNDAVADACIMLPGIRLDQMANLAFQQPVFGANYLEVILFTI